MKTDSPSTLFFISLGCPRNLVDSEVMLGILTQSGYGVSPSLESADYIIINTCGFLEAARKEAIETIQEALDQRKANAKVIVAGCMVQTHSKLLKETFPHIDYLLGSGDIPHILTAIQSLQKGETLTDARSYLESGDVPRLLSTPKHIAYLKIAEGCRKRCAYCIIPQIKGRLKSKPEAQVLKEFNHLLSQGVQEVILIAQDLGDYGKDRGTQGLSGLIHLLEEILKIDQPFWVRLLYLYPDEITDELIHLMKKDPRICPYLDMPIQHINNDLLRAMHRSTSREAIIRTIESLRKEIPNITIRTSLIVGFPGETEEQFEELVTFIQKTPLDNVGIFKFSREEGSAAYSLPHQISEEIKEARMARLMQTQTKVLKKLQKKWLGKKLDVFVEGYHPESRLLMVGRHQGQCPEIDGCVILNEGQKKVTEFGQLYTVEINGIADVDLIGRILCRKQSD